jgi:hypothetical protein
MNAWGADDLGDHHVRFIFGNEGEPRLLEAANRLGLIRETQLLVLSQQLLNGLRKRRLEVEELCPFGRDADSRHSWV